MKIDTDIGCITLGYVKGDLRCEFGNFHVDQKPDPILAEELLDYFSGKVIKRFTVDTPNATPFTNKCWEACRKIPYGETISYLELATRAKSPKAVRAAGQAMRRNPLTILIPCHRVLASNGALHGYSGVTSVKSKELKRKQFLLELEQRTIRA